ncbi:hypothetical protein RHSIM_Rhsim03G0054500 [Rhododendron simsii]|uniref:Uncharacterized protein n=1 Tax=Rhododendron simsii TaxID=118357 RepID=A0A834LSL8_RHOSS|nr:hypothetical protein RHSIM_Rhsim03G0054500 [Rhododendron simsii]
MDAGMRVLTIVGIAILCLTHVAYAATGTATYYTPPYVRCAGTIDLSQEAFSVIANPNAGKINIEYTHDATYAATGTATYYTPPYVHVKSIGFAKWNNYK